MFVDEVDGFGLVKDEGLERGISLARKDEGRMIYMSGRGGKEMIGRDGRDD